jgi:group I intron endonuclease
MTGIYIITNEINSKVYIGKANNIDTRWNTHYKKLINQKYIDNNGNYTHLQKAWNKDGEENFTFDVLEECTLEQLNEKEKYWIAYYESDNPKYGYNKTKGGDGGSPNKEVRKRISESHKGKKLLETTKHKLSLLNKGENNAMYGKKGKLSPSYGLKRSNETKEKLSNSLKGHVVNEETKQKMRDNIGDRTGINNPFFNKQHSEETKQKISNKNKGRKLSEKQKQILIQINTGRVHTIESKQKMREARYKLTDIQVIEILKELNLFNGSKKELSKFMKKLGLKYNVSDKTINRIRLNESYTHIDRELI